MKKSIFLILMLILSSTIFCADEATNNIGEMITLLKTTNFVDAVRAIEDISQKYEGKKIINLSSFTEEIGVPIKQLHWKEALTLIVDFNELVLEELPGVYEIRDPEQITSSGGEAISPDTKQVRISAIFVKIDESFAKNVGIDWSTLINGEVKANVNFRGASAVTEELFTASTTNRLESGEYTIDINTLFKILESHQKGTIIARPNVIVLSGKNGYIQVGEDFSVKSIDEDGNTVDEFFETGIIMEVTPTIIEQGDEEAIHLISKVEKSTAFPGEISTIISRSTSRTEILLYDGEETVIGGLYDVDENVTRQGIPILKDLPWWFLGIRYLTGFNKKEKTAGEMIIILKVEILQPLTDRREMRKSISEKIQEVRKDNRKVHELITPEDIDLIEQNKKGKKK